MKYYRVVCTSKVEDVELETLRDNQINVFSVSLPVGIESTTKSNCKIYEVEEENGVREEKEIGFLRTNFTLDEGELRQRLSYLRTYLA